MSKRHPLAGELSPKTLCALQELMTAAVKHFGGDPDKAIMTVCRPNPIETGSDDYSWCGLDDDYVELTDDEEI